MTKRSFTQMMQQAAHQFTAIAHRFPVTLFFASLTTVILCYFSRHTNNIDLQHPFNLFLILYPASSILVATIVHIAQENWSKHRLKPYVAMGIHLFWLLIMGGLIFTTDSHDEFIFLCALTALLLSWVLILLSLPYLLRHREYSCWKYTTRIVVGFIVSHVVTQVAALSLIALYYFFGLLFSLSVSSQLYIDTAIVCQSLVLPLLFLSFVPTPAALEDETPISTSSIFSNIIRYIYSPILFAYFLTLYAYALKIIIDWELPNGWVGSMVIVVMALVLLLLFLIYPQRFQQERRFEQLLFKWLPLLTLPLLVLMSIGLGRRILDYGWTIRRLYVLTFNLWAYFVCLGLIWTKGKRLFWIPVSVIVLAPLTSFGEQSYPHLIFRSMQASVIETMSTQGLSAQQTSPEVLKKWLQQLDTPTRKKLIAQIDYLQNYKQCQGLGKYEPVSKHIAQIATDTSQEETNYYLLAVMEQDRVRPISLPTHYTHCLYLSKIFNFNTPQDTISYDFSLGNASLRYTVTYPQLKQATQQKLAHPIIDAEHHLLFYPYAISVSENKTYYRIEGILFIQ